MAVNSKKSLMMILLSLFFLFSFSANAGNLLRFNAGLIDTSENASKKYVSQYFVRKKSNPSSSSMNLIPLLSFELSLDKTQVSQVSEYIVQFKRPINENDKSELKKVFKVFGYIPDDGLVVRGTKLQLEKYRKSHSEIRAIVKYAEILKISKDLLPLNLFNKNDIFHLNITLFDSSELESIREQINHLNSQIEILSAGGKYLKIKAPREFLFKIAALIGVEHIELSPELNIFDFDNDSGGLPKKENSDFPDADYKTLTGYEDGTKLIGLNYAWSKGFAGRNQLLAMVDTGVDAGVFGELTRDLQGAVYDGFTYGDGALTWADPMGHGTHIAGIMVGRGYASNGIVRGGAYQAQLIAGSLWSPEMKMMTFPNRLETIFEGPYKLGSHVHSNSWGDNRHLGDYTDAAAQVDEWSFNHPEMLLVFAAGNSGIDADKDGRIDPMSLGVPATAKNCLTVGASKNLVHSGGLQGAIGKMRGGASLWPSEPLYSSEMSENEWGLAAFSSRGPTKDGRIKPDVVAPGTNILSVKSHQKGASSLWSYFNSDYTWSGGTSMSAPLAASAAGVARQILIEKWGINHPSSALVKAALVHTAQDLYPGQFGEIGLSRGQEIASLRPNNDEGYGRLNLQQLVDLGAGTKIFDNHVGVKQDENIKFPLHILKTAKLWANLVWTDAPGSPNVGLTLVNDLDLELVGPNGQIYTNADHVNNLESLELLNLEPGDYVLNVRGFRVPQGQKGAQPFALIFTISE